MSCLRTNYGNEDPTLQLIRSKVEEAVTWNSTDHGFFYSLLFLLLEYSFKYVKSVDSLSLILVKSNDKSETLKVCQ